MPPVTAQQLIDASTDVTNLGKVINGAATDPDVALRTGGTAMTLRKAAATIAKGDTGPQGNPGTGFPTGTVVVNNDVATPGSIAAAGTLTDSELRVITPNDSNMVFAICDSNYRVAFGVDASGELIGLPPSLPEGTDTSNDGISVPGVIADVEMKAISSANALDLVFAITDAGGAVAMGVREDGTVILPGFDGGASSSGTTASPLLNQTANPLAPNVDSLVVYSKPDGSSVQQVFKFHNGAESQLTSGADACTQPSLNQDQSTITYQKTTAGVPAVMRMNRWGQHKTAASNDMLAMSALMHVLISGQSLSTGTASGPVLSTSQPFSNKMFDMGVRPQSPWVGTTVMPTPTSLVPLVETADTANQGETIASGFANTAYEWLMEAGGNAPLLMSCWGVGGTAYAGLKKTTVPYANGQAQVSAGLALASAAGFASVAARALLWVHGEADALNATYDANLATMQSDFETDSMALTGQYANIPMILCQTSGICGYASGFTPDTLLSPYLMLKASVNNPGKIVLTGPSYMCSYNGVHMNAIGYRKQGGYFAKAWHKQVIQNLPWRPLSPRTVKRDGLHVYVDFYVPVAPLVLDLSTVTPPTTVGGKYGFEWFDSSTPPAITAVDIVGPTTIKITLASVPTGSNKALRYAYSFTPNTLPGVNTGQRGNLRDSDPTRNFYGDTLPNWCVHFNQPCN